MLSAMSKDLEAEKRRLRRTMSARRRAVSSEAAISAGRRVAAALLDAAEFEAAPRVALYADHAGELPTRPCFDAVLSAGKIPLLPRMGAERRLSFCRVERWGELRAGRYGVSEPPEGSPPVDLAAADLVLVPGLAFDSAGQRLGRGQGCYDATFPPGTGAPRLFGLGFEWQLVESVPHASHDRGMDAIVTERGVRRITRNPA
jgi:5-formyltetrahydrofolate cyclo-ligase